VTKETAILFNNNPSPMREKEKRKKKKKKKPINTEDYFKKKRKPHTGITCTNTFYLLF